LSNSNKERIAMLIEDDPDTTIEDITQQSGFHVSYCSFIAKKQEAILPSHYMTSQRLECKRLENMHFHGRNYILLETF
ncbi:hypothetical protein L873DRAFT_1806415, partial [Choiromyces venosus 120613-1]